MSSTVTLSDIEKRYSSLWNKDGPNFPTVFHCFDGRAVLWLGTVAFVTASQATATFKKSAVATYSLRAP